MKYIGRKEFLCYAVEDDKTFTIFESNDCYYSHEVLSYDDEASVVIWDSFEEMVEGITWLDYIIEGIQDNKLKKAVGELYEQ